MTASSVSSLKRCTKCREYFPPTSEYFSKKRDGLRPECKVCQSAYDRQYRAENLEKVREYQHRWGVENPDKKRENGRRYHVQNPEKRRESTRRYRVANPEKDRQYRIANPEKDRERSRRYRARKRGLSSTFTTADEQRALDYFHNCCAVCGRQLKDLFGTHTAAMDHWKPLSKGGSTTPDNMLPLCHGVNGCNNRKRASNPVEWVEREFKPRQAKQILRRIETYFQWVKLDERR